MPRPDPEASLPSGRWSGLTIALALVAAIGVIDIFSHINAVFIGFFSLPPMLAAASETPRRTAIAAAAASVAAAVAGLPNEILGSVDHVLRLTVVVVISIASIYVAKARSEREQRLRQVTEIAEVTQRAVLRGLPDELGSVRLSARYLSAFESAQVGGDLYESSPSPVGARILVGDVRGKGLDAVHLASSVMSAFRSSAFGRNSLTDVAADLDEVVLRESTGEEFVTAILVEFREAEMRIANCGHPAPILRRAGGHLAMLDAPKPHPPLGLGFGGPASPDVYEWNSGDRLLLYTDGLIEGRNQAGEFLPLTAVWDALSLPGLDACLDEISERLMAHVGGRSGDDLALVVAECKPPGSTSEPAGHTGAAAAG